MSDPPAPLSRSAIMNELQTAMSRITARPATAFSLSESTRLREDLGLDSFAAVELVFEVEDLLDVRIPQDAAADFQTVADVVSYVSAEMAKPRQQAAELPGGPRVP